MSFDFDTVAHDYIVYQDGVEQSEVSTQVEAEQLSIALKTACNACEVKYISPGNFEITVIVNEPPPPPPGNTVLSILISGMAVNEWSRLPATYPGGIPDFWKPSPNSDPLTAFAHQAYYDPARQQLYFIGAGYGSQSGYIVYDEATDSWDRTVLSENITHSYDHVAYDPSRGLLYFSGAGGGNVRRIDVDTGTLSIDGPMPFTGVDTYGMEFWPALDSIIVSNRSGTVYSRVTGSAFTTFATGLPAAGYHSMLAYNPVRDVMYHGGGHNSLTSFSEISASGVVTVLPNAYYLYVSSTIALVDPVSGDLVVRTTDGTSPAMSKYVHGSGWSTISTSMPSFLANNRTAFGATIEYPGMSVFLYVTTDRWLSQAQVWLYRYN